MKNRFMLAPLTNCQSHSDGRLSDEELNWLSMRARGGFGSTMTCAATVQKNGQGFAGQLGIMSDLHIEGLARLAKEIRAHGSLPILQLHHAGMRSPRELIGEIPVCPSDHPDTGARALSLLEVESLVESFIAAAERAEQAGFEGVEIHGAHGYIICQFLSSEINHRTDRYGGSLENRARVLFEIVEGIRSGCRPDFNLSVRLSAERFGVLLEEAREISQRLMNEGKIDFLDLSLWDVFKEPEEEAFKGRTLLSYFTELERGDVRIGVAGKIYSASDVERCLEAGADFVLLGRAAILHHDFPDRVRVQDDFRAMQTPVSAEHLGKEGLSRAFIEYVSEFPGFVEPPEI